MAGNEILINLTAINTTGPEFEKVRAATKTMQDTVATASKSMGEGFNQVSRVTRALAADVGSSLNPMLGTMVGNLGLVARGAGSMGAALAGVTAVAVVGAVALKTYFDSVTNAAEAQARLNIAVKSFDLASTQSAMLAASVALEARAERAKTFVGSLGNALGDLSDALGITRSAMQDLQAAAAATEQNLPLARTQSVTEALLQQAQAWVQLRAVQLGRAESLGAETDYLRVMKLINDALGEQFDREEDLLNIKAKTAIGAAEARHASPAEIGMIRRRLAKDLETVNIRGVSALEATSEQQRRFTMGRFAAELQTAVAAGGSMEQATAGVSPEDSALGAKRRAAEAERLFTIEQARLNVMREQGDLSDKQRLSLDLSAIAGEARLKLQQAGLDVDKQELATLEAAARTTERVRVGLEQSDPLMGLAAGFRTAADEAERSGAIMSSFAQQTAGNMSRAFSDQFFNVMTGRFKDLSAVANSFSAALLRSVTDALGQMMTAPLLRALGGGPGGGQTFIRGLGVLGGGMSAGGIVQIEGQLFQSVAAGGGQTVLVPVSAGSAGGASVAGSVATGGAGGAGAGVGASAGGALSLFGSTSDAIRAFLNTPLSSIAPSLFGASTLAPSFSAGATAAELQALGASGAEISAATTGAGATIGTALGAAAAVAALAFTVYSGLSNPPTAQSIASGFVSGAISGAIIGSYFPPYGTAVGAVAGGLLGGGAAALGKEDPAVNKARKQAEIDRAVGAASGLGGAVGATTSIQELFDLLTTHNSGAVGGTSGVAIVSLVYASGQPRVGEALFVGRPNATYPVATVEEFARFGPTSYVAVIQAGVNPAHLSGPNQSLEAAVRSKITQLNQAAQRISQIEISTSDVLAQPLPFGGGVTRVTKFRGDRAAAFAGQEFSIEGPSLVGLAVAEKIGFLKDLAKLDRDLNLNILYRDPATDEIVSLSMTGATGLAMAG